MGPILFLLYTADLIGLVTRHGLCTHLYADDTQVYGFCSPSKSGDLQSQLSTCVEDIAKWMGANRLQLNAAKTEILWCSSQRRVDQLPSLPFLICGSSVGPSSVVRDLGVWIDNGLTMSTHISKVVAGCFASLRQLRSVRRSLSHESFTRLVVALVLARLDYCNGVLAGLPASQLSRLQSVLHAAARLIYGVRRYDHVTPLLQQLHWLSVPERVTFKLCVMVYRCLHRP